VKSELPCPGGDHTYGKDLQMTSVNQPSLFSGGAKSLNDEIEILPEPDEFNEEITPPQTSDAEDALDEALIETFPASDPIASGRWE
jgi:hypothetical protein